MIQKIKKYGFFTKGFVYVILGLLTFLAAIEMGGKVADKNAVITFLEDQMFGKVLLFIISLGLLSYAIWRFYKSYLVIKEKKDNQKYFISIDFFFRGIIYSSFAISILYKVINQERNGFSRNTLAEKILATNYGQIILFGIALIIFFSAINQFYIVYKKAFLKDINKNKNIESFTFLERSGKFGITSSGISFLIFAYFIFRASLENAPEKIRGTEGMFNYLHDLTFGNILMAIMALGFLSYGIFQYFYGRYSNS